MKVRLPLGIALPTLALAICLPAQSQAQNIFVVGDGNWNSDIWNTTNTSPGVENLRPLPANTVILQQGGRALTINSNVGSITTLRSANTSGSVAINLASGAILDITTLLDLGRPASGIQSTTLSVQSGAKLTVGTNGIRLGNTNGGTATARLNINGGEVISSGPLIIAQGTDAATKSTGILTLSAGSLTTSTLQRGLGSVTFDWTGGTLVVGQTNLTTIANTGAGIFAVGGVGTVGQFSIMDNATTAYTQGDNASIALDFASDLSFDKITVGGAGAALNLTLDGSISINLLAGFIPTNATTFDVITATSITDNGFVLTGAGAGYFTHEIVNIGGSDILRLTAVPEPSTYALLTVVGALGMALRRRFSR